MLFNHLDLNNTIQKLYNFLNLADQVNLFSLSQEMLLEFNNSNTV